jgi:hypothetical protein
VDITAKNICIVFITTSFPRGHRDPLLSWTYAP